MKQDEVKKILQEHAAWLEYEKKGKRAEFYTGDWRAADLHGADLRKAFISVAADTTELYDKIHNEAFYTGDVDPDLDPAPDALWDIYRSELQGADLSNADLTGAKLFSANLEDAVLAGAKLVGADLSPRTYTDCEASMYAEFEGYDDDGERDDGEREDTPTKLKNADLSNANLRGVKGYTPKKTSSKRNSARKAYERGTT